MKIAFFIGSVDISGGTYVIYQHALHASQCGHDVTIVVLYPYDQSQLGWHPATRQLRFVPVAEVGQEHFDLAVATWWKTATELHTLEASRYAFFVQSIESRFYPDEEIPLKGLVDRTYDLGLPTITEASWIKEYLRTKHHCTADLVRNGIRKDLYTQNGPAIAARPNHGRMRVLVEGPMGVPFKNVGNSLRLSRKSRAESTWLLTSTRIRTLPFIDRVFSHVPVASTPEIYRSCDVLLKLSYVEGMFGPPLEMFHCGGTSVVYDVTGHDEYIRDGINAMVVARDDENGVINALNRLNDDPELLASMKEAAAQTAAAWPDWTQSSREFLDALISIGDSPDRETIRNRNSQSMAEYVELENQRLAAKPQRPDRKLESFVQRHPRLAELKRHYGFLREYWP
ncbi:glycosyltransferase [Solilutibacter silvestris]|uniref:glycosyltransferase n=1 Tax=Solilutibacter silvestris TaxID=1645665 RepID=UPI003D345B57